jgi:serine protease AprX
LANNLNLFLHSPSGEVYVGNRRGPYRAELMLDAHNNVEVIEVPQAAAGVWTLAVVGSNVPQGPQDFALAAVMV